MYGSFNLFFITFLYLNKINFSLKNVTLKWWSWLPVKCPVVLFMVVFHLEGLAFLFGPLLDLGITCGNKISLHNVRNEVFPYFDVCKCINAKEEPLQFVC